MRGVRLKKVVSLKPLAVVEFQEKAMTDAVVTRFEKADEVRTFEKGKFELVRIGGMTVGRATYDPGWKWSDHVGKALGKKSCDVEHVGLVVSGRAAVAMDDGRVLEIGPGDLFHIGPGHDSWVLGEEPYVSLHLMGASHYAAKKSAGPSDTTSWR
jgi:quercetin dioxygenase-like cupin family protein